jgi:hypothetical protein
VETLEFVGKKSVSCAQQGRARVEKGPAFQTNTKALKRGLSIKPTSSCPEPGHGEREAMVKVTTWLWTVVHPG